MKLLKKNKKAYLDYEIIEFYTAGIILKGFEVKVVKSWQSDIRNAFAYIRDWEAWLANLTIPMYKNTNSSLFPLYDAKMTRKLLLKKWEIKRLVERTHKTWLILVALDVMEVHKKVKIKLWLWKLRRKIEKKQIIKERDVDRQARRDIKNYK